MNDRQDKITEASYTKSVILFDGLCNLCISSVRFIIKRDISKRFLFASMQSEVGQLFLSNRNYSPVKLNSIILVEKSRIYERSDALLRIAGKLTVWWRWLLVLRIVPPFIRDAIYIYIAKKRYAWFGKKESCMIPSPELLSRFIDDLPN